MNDIISVMCSSPRIRVYRVWKGGTVKRSSSRPWAILTDRLVQEEVWSQTVWPTGEPVLTDDIMKNAGPHLPEMLASARKELGVGRLGIE